MTPGCRFALILLAGGACAITSAARADLKSYISPVNSSWQANLAWSPIGAPSILDDLVFDRTLPSFITFDTASNVSHFQTFRKNTVNVDVPGLHVVSTGMMVAKSTDAATLNLRHGTLAVNATSTLGSVNGGHGLLRLEEPDVTFSVNGTASVFTVGRGGAGDVFIDQGSVLDCYGPESVGDLSTSCAAIHVSGVSPNFPSRISTFRTNGSTGDVIIGDAGIGFLNLHTASRLAVFGNAGLSGSLDVRGFSPTTNGRWTVMTFASHTGTFASASFPSVTPGGFRLDELSNRVDVVFCLMYFNGDGSIDPDDLGDFITGFFGPGC